MSLPRFIIGAVQTVVVPPLGIMRLRIDGPLRHIANNAFRDVVEDHVDEVTFVRHAMPSSRASATLMADLLRAGWEFGL